MSARNDIRPLRGAIHLSGPGVDRELLTFTCPHCSSVGIVGARYDPDTLEVTGDPEGGDNAGWCFRCAAYLCKSAWCHDQRDAAGNPIHVSMNDIAWDSTRSRPKLDIGGLMGVISRRVMTIGR